MRNLWFIEMRNVITFTISYLVFIQVVSDIFLKDNIHTHNLYGLHEHVSSYSIDVKFPHRKPKLSGGGLESRYVVKGLHFHCGANNMRGSEHNINGKQYPLELHIEFQPMVYGKRISTSKNGKTAVIGIIVDIGRFNPKFDRLISLLSRISDVGQMTVVPSFTLTDLFPESTKCFYRYCGSLTTPPCTESIIWSIFVETVYISQNQMNEFRKLKGKKQIFTNSQNLIIDTFRPIQPLFERQIILSCPNYKTYGSYFAKNQRPETYGCVNCISSMCCDSFNQNSTNIYTAGSKSALAYCSNKSECQSKPDFDVCLWSDWWIRELVKKNAMDQTKYDKLIGY